MAQTGYTPISIYYSSTASNTPTAGNLVAGELAINTADGKLFYKDSSGVVQVIGTKGGVGSSTTTQVLYNSSGLVVGSANMVFDGSTLTTLNSAYTGTLTGGTGVVNLGSGQFYKDASGNVGIGTSSPSSASGTSLAIYNSSGQARLAFKNGVTGNASTDGFQVGIDGDGMALVEQRENLAMTFSTNATERMRIDSSGYVYVGCTSSPSASVFGARIGTNGTNFWLSSASVTSSYQHMQFGNTNGFVGSISTSASSTIFSTTSDYRLKTVIGSVSDAGTRIDALEPIEYEWKTGGKTRGFLAHKFAEVYPASVSGEKDAIDKEGKPVYQNMQASTPEVMADLIAEIQSLRKRVAQLESK